MDGFIGDLGASGHVSNDVHGEEEADGLLEGTEDDPSHLSCQWIIAERSASRRPAPE